MIYSKIAGFSLIKGYNFFNNLYIVYVYVCIWSYKKVSWHLSIIVSLLLRIVECQLHLNKQLTTATC